MLIFVFMFLWALGITYFFERKKQVYMNLNENSKIFTRKYILGEVAFALFPMFFFCIFRTRAIGDTGAYILNFKSMPQEFIFPKTLNRCAFLLLESFTKAYISNQPAVWLAIMALIPGILMIICLTDYSQDQFISMTVLFGSVSFIYYFNGCRQWISIWICVYALMYARWNLLYFYFLIIIAISFHLSSIIMLPAVFLAKEKTWGRKTFLIIFITIIFCLFSNSFSKDIIDILITGTEYEQYIDNINSGGINPLRVIIDYIPIILCLIYKEKIDRENNAFLNMCINMSVVGALLNTTGFFFTSLFSGRLASYYLVFNIFIYPILFKKILPEKSVGLLKIIFVLCYFFCFYYQIKLVWNIPYISDILGIYCS